MRTAITMAAIVYTTNNVVPIVGFSGVLIGLIFSTLLCIALAQDIKYLIRK